MPATPEMRSGTDVRPEADARDEAVDGERDREQDHRADAERDAPQPRGDEPPLVVGQDDLEPRLLQAVGDRAERAEQAADDADDGDRRPGRQPPSAVSATAPASRKPRGSPIVANRMTMPRRLPFVRSSMVGSQRCDMVPSAGRTAIAVASAGWAPSASRSGMVMAGPVRRADEALGDGEDPERPVLTRRRRLANRRLTRGLEARERARTDEALSGSARTLEDFFSEHRCRASQPGSRHEQGTTSEPRRSHG